MPYSIADWRRAQRYVLAKYTTDEVQIVRHKKSSEDEKAITETHKVLDLSKRLPTIIRKVLSGNAAFVDEYSTNIDIVKTAKMVKDVSSEKEIHDTMIKTEKLNISGGPLQEVKRQEIKELRGNDSINKNEATKGLEDPLLELRSENMSKDTIKNTDILIRDEEKIKNDDSKTKNDDNKTKNDDNKNDDSKTKNGDNKNDENKKEKDGNAPSNTRDSTFSESFSESKYVNRYYSTETFHLMVKTYVRDKDETNIFGLPDGFKSREIDLRGDSPKSGIIVFKMVEVAVNSTFFGWIAEHIKNMMRDMLVKFQEKIIETEKEWMNISEEELMELEEEMIRKYLIN